MFLRSSCPLGLDTSDAKKIVKGRLSVLFLFFSVVRVSGGLLMSADGIKNGKRIVVLGCYWSGPSYFSNRSKGLVGEELVLVFGLSYPNRVIAFVVNRVGAYPLGVPDGDVNFSNR